MTVLNETFGLAPIDFFLETSMVPAAVDKLEKELIESKSVHSNTFDLGYHNLNP